LNEKLPENLRKGPRGGEPLKSVKITFRDSLKLLPGSLNELGTRFKVETLKGDFPYTFITRETLEYVGRKPDKKFYRNVKEVAYDQICEPWDARKESLDYLTKDLISLHQVILSFRSIIFNKYQQKVENFLTLSALAFGIFRGYFMGSDCDIRLSHGAVDRDIRKAYMGGIVEIFKNFGKNLVCLDINSLYPFAMLNDMPTGSALLSVKPELGGSFGFFYAEVHCPETMKYPTLPFRHPKLGVICPTGRWKG
jgi:hypothetical protein